MLYIILFFSLMFIACDNAGNDEQKLSEHEVELLYNYHLLKSYFYHPERIKEYSEYEGITEIDFMYSSLNDTLKGIRHTQYFKPDIADNIFGNLVNSDEYYSFGFERWYSRDTLVVGDEIVISYTLFVAEVYPISPAADAGLKKYDTLLSANGIPLRGITDTNIVLGYLRSDSLFASSTVFEVLRGTESLLLPLMQKEEVWVPTVYLDSLVGIPHMYITEFTRRTNNPYGTYYEFIEYLKEIEGAKTAIIDLRYNRGGEVWHCTAMAAELVPLNSMLIYDVEHYQNKYGENRIDTTRYFTNMRGIGAGINWIILMNRWSASCSERFIAAVKYNRPATRLIGETSYGKGIGQSYGYTYLGGLASITSLQSYYPDWRTFHEVGIEPDIFVDLYATNNDYIAAIEAAAQSFGVLSKRSIRQEAMPPVRKSKKTDLGMYYLLD